VKPLHVDDSGFIFEEDNNEIVEHNLQSEFSPLNRPNSGDKPE